MEKFRINNDLSIFWSITEKNGSPYTLSDKTVRLFVTHPRGRMDVTSDITIQDNVICWLFRGSKQRYLGTYKITVEIQATPADRIIRKDIPEAFVLVSSTQYEQTEIGRPDINETGELTLATSLDIFQIYPIIPQVGPNSNWWVDGVDTGKSSVGPQGDQGPQGPAGPSYDDTEIKAQLTELSADTKLLYQEVNGGKDAIKTSSTMFVAYPLVAGRTYIIDTTTAVKNVSLFARKNQTSEGQEVITHLEYVRSVEYTPTSDFPYLYVYFSSSASGEVAFSISAKESLSDVKNLAGKVSDIEASTEALKSIEMIADFNGTTSQCSVNLISLSKEGDYLEMDVTPNIQGQVNSYYACVTGATKTKISIGCSLNAVAVRASDNTWMALGVNIGARTRYVLGIYYRNGNIEIAVDGEVVSTYSGYKTIDIGGFGYAESVNSYWSGIIGKLTINGVTYDTIANLQGFNATDIVITGRYGFLTQEQNSALAEVNMPKFHIIPSADLVNVYFHINSNVYGRLGIKHSVNHSDNDGQNGYCDLWGLFDRGGIYLREGNFYTNTGKQLLINSENEFTIQFAGMEDFTGGYHGDERIDLAADDYVEFLVDGEVYTIEELVALGEVYCSSFSYRQHSTLYASYIYDTAHKKLGNHFKETFFVNSGYVTRNYMKLDLTALNVSELKTITAFTGLVCAYKDVANVVVADDGKQYVGVNPSASTSLVDYMNRFSRRVSMHNGDYSCVIDSKLLDTSVESWKASAPRVQIVDRQYDEKYYSYLPMNTMMADGDYLATECSVEFNVHN